MPLNVIKIDTPSLGDRSYLIHDGVNALVIDPQRDIDRIENLLNLEGLVLLAVAETHIHNDYLTGGLILARKYDAPYIIHNDAVVAFERYGISDQETFVIGDFAIRAIHTPGHTFTHMAYLILDAKEVGVGLATGGSLLHGSTGRPDLLGWDKAPELARLQFESAHRLVTQANKALPIYPTHGFGSFCSATPTLTDSSTIGDQSRVNPVLNQQKTTFVKQTLQNLDVYPNYFDHMGPANSKSPDEIPLTELPEMNAEEIEAEMSSGTCIVDLRSRTSYVLQHVYGSTNLGLDGSMASYLGWIYPYQQKLILMSDTASDITKARRELFRIGIDHPFSSFVGSLENFEYVSAIASVKFKDIACWPEDQHITVLDVRQNLERKKSHIAESMHIPFYEVSSRVEELPIDNEIWVHCASGYRAASVLGIIEKSGRNPVLIDDDFANAIKVSALEIL